MPFRFLPGVSSAFGALAAARIPATQRGVSKALILATGHAVGTADDLDWAALARTGQPIVVYMGLAALGAIAAALMRGGLDAGDPGGGDRLGDHAATSGCWSPTSAASPRGSPRRASRPPAVIVVGAIVALRDELLALARAGAAGVTARALIVGAARSGSGKTSVSVGLMRALARRGLAVRGAKSGPDYIDPGFHAAATGAPGVNLDSWAMPPDAARPARRRAGGGRRRPGRSRAPWASSTASPPAPGRSGAAADLARRFGMPVVLILDVSGQSQTAAAIARGFATHDPAVRDRRA